MDTQPLIDFLLAHPSLLTGDVAAVRTAAQAGVPINVDMDAVRRLALRVSPTMTTQLRTGLADAGKSDDVHSACQNGLDLFASSIDSLLAGSDDYAKLAADVAVLASAGVLSSDTLTALRPLIARTSTLIGYTDDEITAALAAANATIAHRAALPAIEALIDAPFTAANDLRNARMAKLGALAPDASVPSTLADLDALP